MRALWKGFLYHSPWKRRIKKWMARGILLLMTSHVINPRGSLRGEYRSPLRNPISLLRHFKMLLAFWSGMGIVFIMSTSALAATDVIPIHDCQFEVQFEGIKLNGIYNGPVICRSTKLDELKVNGATHLVDSNIEKQLYVRGSLNLDHSQAGFIDVFGDVEGEHCAVHEALNLFGNYIKLENCTAQDINLYYGGLSTFAPQLVLHKSKVLGKIHFYHRSGFVIKDAASAIGAVENGVVKRS